MDKATKETLDDLQSEISEIESMSNELVDSIQCAISCETVKDFNDNVLEIKRLVEEIQVYL